MKRELVVTADGQERAVAIDGVPGATGQFRVTIDGIEHVVDARAIRPGTWSILLDGRNFLVDLDRRRAGIAASVGDSETMLVVEDALHRRLAQAAAGGRGTVARGESIRAPIAGKVVKVLVAPGDTVAAGAAVIVLEAMKMENELISERGGTIGAIHKQAGQAVDTGDLLIDIT
ncbi:MAG: biotin attachment protein [Deltaproteobacteria bacterium]|nr:biotin attachment protein [Deltaproteobacteria bacterium]